MRFNFGSVKIPEPYGIGSDQFGGAYINGEYDGLLHPMNALLIDGLNLVRRIYAAVPGDQETLDHFEGALESTLSSLRRALAEVAPSHVVCVFDGDGETWRHQLLPEYKKDRPPMPDTLQSNFHRVREVIEEIGIQTIDVPRTEADDVIATIAVKIAARDGRVVILSTDKSMCQLASDRIRVRDHFAGRDLDRSYIKEKFGVSPSQLPTLFALVGDKSVGIPGVTFIGARTGAKLINTHGTLEEILANAESIPGRPGKALQEETQAATLSLALVKLKTDINVGINLNQLRISNQ